MKAAVLGAGISGITAARLLTDKGIDVTVYEKNPTAGGLARTRYKDGYLYDPHGGHILNSKHKEVMDWVFSIMPQELWQYTVRNAKIYFKGKMVSYPFELSLCELDAEDTLECVFDFMTAREGAEPENYRDWLIWNFGGSIAEKYMIPYNEKIWSYPLEKMETKWMQGKMPLPSKKEILHSVLLKDPSERKMPHSTFYYPISGGIQSMVDHISKNINILFNAEVQWIEKANNKWFINGDGPYDQVISTIPLPIMPKIMKLNEKIKAYIQDLKWNSLTTALFSCPETDITWLYIPSHEYKSHRVGYQSALTPNAVPVQGTGCGALEIIGKKFDVDEKLVKDRNIVPECLGFREVLDSEFTEYAYVIHDLNYRSNINNIKEYFEKMEGFHLLGRWATWNYKNMDLCMYDAFKLIRRIEKEE